MDYISTHYIELIAALFGAMLHWVSWRYGKDILTNIDMFVEELGTKSALALLMRVLISSVIGATIGCILTTPETGRQALAAGMAWTTLMASLRGAPRPRR